MLDGRQVVLVDMDGVLVYGAYAAPGAAAFVRKFEDRLCVVTNESAFTPKELSERLSHRSLQIPPNRLIMAGPTAIEKLNSERSDANVLIRGAPGLRALAEIAGIRTARQNESVDVVLLGRDPDFNVSALETIVRAVEDGAELWVTNPDLRHPIENGRHTFQTGALLHAVLACLDDVPVTVIGKPQPELFNVALSRLDANPEDAIMIGDNPKTDGAGASAAGIPFVLVGPAPAATAANLAELLQNNGE